MELEALLASAATSFPCSTSTAKAASASGKGRAIRVLSVAFLLRGLWPSFMLRIRLEDSISYSMQVDVPAVERIFRSMTKTLNYFIRSTQRHQIII